MAIDSVPTPVTLRWAVRLLRGQAVVVGLIAAGLLVANFTATRTDLLSAVLITLFAAGAAAALWALGGALLRHRAGARAPAIVLQLMLLPIGWFMIQGGLGWLGVPLIALGIGVTWLLVSPPTTRALGFE
ncbi:hypothetical protein [Micromonospora endophytica]|uniref:Uncharacterized protein n=1 Tax=Micromonospora endophytica TaxID=515350 RepID=A0A2W2CDD9_9ACTN|nr:hypothetical protein [Micromonospora endophytica]PZF90824.1 hypothetical protein C1I93_22290 [Micromonospora endophytica]RIW44519.1 hypothetical protein D3H59_17695 [Micromonospora endophytica]